MGMEIAPGFVLPPEAVTETFAMLAKRGTGKSNAAVVMAEAMWDAGFQWVAIDPKGDWWGIRSSADGKGDGLPVLVLGGRHGDLPLDASAGALMASLAVERRVTMVLDVSLFSKGDQIKFVTDFAETLFRRAADDPAPLHLFLEEAEEFLPQRVDARSARMVGAYSKIAKQGRTSGLGVTLITQRSASLNKDALSQTDTLFLFRTVSPHDRRAVVAWAEHHGEAAEIAGSLAELVPGESWVLSPGFLGSIQRIQWNRRRTFDSGATPVAGAARSAPVSLAEIDLAEIKELMAETVEKATADDPKVLRKRIAELERQVKALEARPAEPEVVTVTVETVPEPMLTAIATLADYLDHGAKWSRNLLTAAEFYETAEATPQPAKRQPAPTPEPELRRSAPSPAAGPGAGLPGPQRKLLTVLAVYGQRTVRQLALQAGYSQQGGGFRNPLGALRSAGYVTKGDPLEITEAGLAALGPYDPLPTGQALLDQWLSDLPGPAAKILAAIAAWPDDAIDVDTLADRCGYSAQGGGFRNPLGRLRTLGLVDKGNPVRLTDEFKDAIDG